MASFVESTLMPGEHVIVRARPSRAYLIFMIIVGIITLPIFLMGFFLICYAISTYVSTELAVTNKRIVAKTGMVMRNSIELNISKVESVQVRQSIFGRIFNYGSLVISGAGNPQAPIPCIKAPMEFRKLAVQALEKA